MSEGDMTVTMPLEEYKRLAEIAKAAGVVLHSAWSGKASHDELVRLATALGTKLNYADGRLVT